MDIAIAVLLGAFTISLAYMGLHVTLHPQDSPPSKLRWKVGFGSVALLTCVLIAWQTVRNVSQQAAMTSSLSVVKGDLELAQKQLNNANEALARSALSQEFMKGQLSGLSMMVGKIGSDGSVNSSNLVKALGQISSSSHGPNGVEAPAIQRMTNAQLKARVIDFANDLRKLAFEFDGQGRRVMEEQMDAMNAAHNSPKEQKDKIWDSYTRREAAERQAHSLQVQTLCIGPASEYRDELVRRLGPRSPKDEEKYPFTFWDPEGRTKGTPGEMELEPSAEYLENLARQLP
ncbi:MAG TPA: hypothetical protein VGL00_13850 [Terracidiphilus sp.]